MDGTPCPGFGEDFEGVEVPGGRASIPDMQQSVRLRRVTRGFDCSEAQAEVVVAHENLVAEIVHLCEAGGDGMPYYTRPPGVVARIMARDSICEVSAEEVS